MRVTVPWYARRHFLERCPGKEKARWKAGFAIGRWLLRGHRFTAERLCSCHRCFFRRSARRAGVRYSIACADNGRDYTSVAALQQHPDPGAVRVGRQRELLVQGGPDPMWMDGER